MENDLKVHIGGIKFSEELVQITVPGEPTCHSPIKKLLHLVAEQNINIPFLCLSTCGESPETSFCVAHFEHDRVQQLCSLCSLEQKQMVINPKVGTLTLFPHRNSFSVLGSLLQLFGVNGYPVYSLSTSISAIALNTDYALLDEIAEKLQSLFTLPENHAPFRQGYRLTQIEAR